MEFDGMVLQVSVGNGRYHGGGLSSGPDAQIDDGKLHIYAVASASWWRLLPVIPGLILGLHRMVGHVRSFDAWRCTVETHRPKRATVDGELVDHKVTKFEFSVLKDALEVFAPSASPASWLTPAGWRDMATAGSVGGRGIARSLSGLVSGS